MDQPSSSNVTGRRKRNVIQDDDDDYVVGTPMRRVRGTKRQTPLDIAPDSVMAQVNEKVDEIVNRKKIGTANCFEYKSPLELYGIEKMIEARASIQEMAVVLESAQIMIGYRVDRLHHDVRNVDAVISGRDMGRAPGGEESVTLSMDNRKARKKMAISDGMNGMEDFLNQIDDEEPEENNENGREQTEDNDNAGEATIDPKANSRDVDLFLERDVMYDEEIERLATKRATNFHLAISNEASTLVSADDLAHDLKDPCVDWLKSNSMFQKATRGDIDNTSTSFHSLNHYGLHSPSGRALALHPRIIDKKEDDRYFVSDLSVSLANNTRALLENSLSKKPMVIDNYLMLEVRDRPVIGKYKIMSKDVKKSTLPLSEAARERDLANLTFAEVSRANSRPERADMTIAGSSDMSMLPGHQGLPLAAGENEDTIIVAELPGLDPGAQNKSTNDEYIPPALEKLDLDEALIGKIPMDPMDMDELTSMFDEKLNDYNTLDSFESKLWKNGLLAEEWGNNDEHSVKMECRSLVTAGIDGWIKATDAWTNYEPVKMVVTRDTCFGIDEDHESSKNVQPNVGTHLFLIKSDEFMNNYPGDRSLEIKMVGEELDVMKMVPGVEGDEDERPLEEIQREIQQRNIPEVDFEPDDDYQPGAYDDNVDFNDQLAAPADTDDYVYHAPANDEAPAEILFNNPVDESNDQGRDEQAIRQRNVEDIALGVEEVAGLMTDAPPPEIVGPSAEMREEIRNIGKTDNAHWIQPEIADHERAAVALARQKKRDKKSKIKKVTVEEYVHYFRDIPEEERHREVSSVKCVKVADERSTFLTEQQIYLRTLGTENKPHIALDLTTLTTSGLFFKTESEIPHSIRNMVKQKNFGKLRLERTKMGEEEEPDLFTEDTKGNKESDCLSWLLTFSGFKCMENPDAVTEANNTQPFNNTFGNDADFEIPFTDEYDRYNPRYAQQLALSQMGDENRKKLAHFSSALFNLQNDLRPRKELGEYEDSDDEFEDSFDRQTLQTKNLDAAKHKKCLADILNNQTLSMPSIQFAIEQLTLNQQNRKNNTTIRPSTSDRDATVSSPVPYDLDATLKTVFDYNSPSDVNHNVKEIMDALTDITTYGEPDLIAPNPSQPSTSKYGTVNTENNKVKINGIHTLLSLALSMPPKMAERVKPSSIVSFLLHLANENGLKIVQDRSKKQWMTDFVVLNQADNLPNGLHLGDIDEQGEFWSKTQDPDAVEGSASDTAPLFTGLLNRPRAVPSRKGGRAARPASPMELGAIAEEDEAD